MEKQIVNKLTVHALGYKVDGKALIDDITLEFCSGNLHGILGPNGSGKSTFLKALTGIWKPTSGSILWNEQSLLIQERRYISRTISLVPQNPQINFDFLVEDIVVMGRYSHHEHYWEAFDEQQLEEALRNVDALHLRKRRVDCLSHGERQRVYIARALMTQSPVMLLDEPTACLDIRHQIEIWQLLQKLVSQGKLVIVTTHDLTVAQRHCHQIAVLNKGKCISHGDFPSTMTPSLLQEVFGVTSLT